MVIGKKNIQRLFGAAGFALLAATSGCVYPGGYNQSGYYGGGYYYGSGYAPLYPVAPYAGPLVIFHFGGHRWNGYHHNRFHGGWDHH
ncbi:MAG: hypothetical protein KGI37_08825 [Alphaproteobacteria bacterium]|nr:hypothetical protein [Alphaproteobacteria bacterium]